MSGKSVVLIIAVLVTVIALLWAVLLSKGDACRAKGGEPYQIQLRVMCFTPDGRLIR